ncbi:MAG: glycoside hydrolase family 3 protein [Chitinivibrionales bacterium]|nr:glycoside hydrolase family 3 protein [Chitinivibrionales bacterium]
MPFKLSPEQETKIDSLMGSLNLEGKISQMLCPWRVTDPKKAAEVAAVAPVGCLYLGNDPTAADVKAICEPLENKTGIPVIVCGDMENGSGPHGIEFPKLMGCGAVDSEEMVYEMARVIAHEGRLGGRHWNLGPVVDINFNFQNPAINIRSFGELPAPVARLAGAYVRGLQDNNLMAATGKHFPGDGVEDRDQHLSTTVNSLSRADWFKTYGRVWKKVIDEDIMSIMAAHLALPFMDKSLPTGRNKFLGYKPATLSRRILIDLLRKELGFEGVIVSDAIVMMGFGAHVRPSEAAAAVLKSGCDIVLWSDELADFKNVLDACKKGELKEKQIDQSVRRVLRMKARLGLFENRQIAAITPQEQTAHQKLAVDLSEKSIVLVRDIDNLLPLKLKPGAKVLTVTICHGDAPFQGILDDELKKRGLLVDHVRNPVSRDLQAVMMNYEVLFINFVILNHNNIIGTTRLTSKLIEAFWGTFWTIHPKVVFTSFGTPYVLYEFTSFPNMINAFGFNESTQKAAVKIWLGEIKPTGKSPVSLPGIFKRGIN